MVFWYESSYRDLKEREMALYGKMFVHEHVCGILPQNRLGSASFPSSAIEAPFVSTEAENQ
jgi:hypothetical protein